MNESIIVGLVVGVGVAAVGAIVGHCLRIKEMKEQWAEDERRRRSDHKRHTLEEQLAIVAEFIDFVLEAWSSLEWWSHVQKDVTPEARAEIGKDAFLLVPKANVVALSLGDQELYEGLTRFVDIWEQCNDLVNGRTAQPKEGRQEEYTQLQLEMRKAGAQVRRRIRQLLEAV
jgi:hypothetical protein